MTLRSIRIVYFFVFCICNSYGFAQVADSLLRKSDYPIEMLRVFLDCEECDFDYTRRSIPFVTYVRDSRLAHVHILITDQGTASGGREFRLALLGRRLFAGEDHHLTYISPQSNTEDEERRGLTRVLKMGLMPYVAQTPIAQQVNIEYEEREVEPVVSREKDPWKNWVFHVDVGGAIEAESSQNQITLSGAFEAERITPIWKIKAVIEYEYEREQIEDDDEQITSTLLQREAAASVVKSLDARWSAGFFGNIGSTTFKNIDLNIEFAPAIEVNIFPWSESDRRITALAYRAGVRSFRYEEETLFNKTKEMLLFEALRLDMEMVQPWGALDLSIEGSHFFHDFTKNRLEIESEMDLRVTKWLSLTFNIAADSIHDQLFLPKGDATREEVLLKRRQLATSFEIQATVGLRFTFGSIYSNVVNRRL